MKFLTVLEKAGIEILSADPSPTPVGRIWFNTTSNELKYRGNSATHVISSGGGSGTKVVTARAYKTGDLSYSGGAESGILNNTQWAKADPQNIINLSTNRITIPSSIFTGVVQVRVKLVLSLQGANSFTNWRYVAPICRKDGSLAFGDYRGYGKDFYTENISAGVPSSGTTGSPMVDGESVFEMNAGENFAPSIYTNQGITTDSQSFISFLYVEMIQM